ncbi:hypothetical protein BEN48_14725 [Hymenobacter glacialis]|uniref:Uncharacterized protein n=1 Tax=Hymenobacter glacialis TaxID=1908236 RepID=A0A1G1T374_9BACT|nr:hypothetical protein BEN48_14725 [Hymenobacter glacialis]
MALLLTSVGCSDKTDATPMGQTCENEHLLETYHDREGRVIQAIDQYWLSVAPEDFNRESFSIGNVLVPTTPIPTALRINGLQVKVSGRKKSCYGLVTLPSLRTNFGHKIELERIEHAPE